MNKSSGNKVHFNTAGLTTEESGGLSRFGSVVLPPGFKLPLEEEKVELLQVRASWGGALPPRWGLGLGQACWESPFRFAFPEESSKGTLCTKSLCWSVSV